MFRFIFKKTITSILIFFIMFVLLYFLINGVVGIPISRGTEFATDELWHAELARLGLDKSLVERFALYVKNIFNGNFGFIYSTSQSNVANMFFDKIGNSMLIALPSFIIGMIVGIFFGYWAGIRNNKIEDKIISGFSMFFIVSPIFVFAGYVVLLAPLMKQSTTFVPITNMSNIANSIKSIILPVVILTLVSSSYWTIYIKKDVAKITNMEFIHAARAIGFSEWKILKSYLLRNSLSNIIKMIAPLFMLILSFSLVMENLFSVPGLTSLLMFSIENNEVNIILFISYFFVVVAIASDLIFTILNVALNPVMRTSLRTKNAITPKLQVSKTRKQNEIHELALQLKNSIGGEYE